MPGEGLVCVSERRSITAHRSPGEADRPVGGERPVRAGREAGPRPREVGDAEGHERHPLLQGELAGEPPYRLRQVWEWAARGATSYGGMTNLPAPLRARLEQRVPFSSLELVQEARSRDGTVKALFRTADGHPVEAVLMRYRDGRRSVCVS